MWAAITVPGGFYSHALPPYLSVKSDTYIKNMPNISQHMYWAVSGETLRFSQTLNGIHNSEHERNQIFQSNLKNLKFYFFPIVFY